MAMGTCEMRQLESDIAPDAIVIGAMRAGTTSLYHLFRQSGQASVPESKETDFFLTPVNMEVGASWYSRQFGKSNLPKIDFCPNYTKRDVFPDTWRLIKKHAGNAKLVFVARDPVKRVVSQYKHSILFGEDLPSPSEWLDTKNAAHAINVSRYAYQMQPFFDHWDRDDILIVDFADMLKEPKSLVRVGQHVGISDPEALQTVELPSKNSAADLNALPNWWHRMRSTRLGHMVRQHAPRSLIENARNAIRSKSQKNVLPDFDASVIKSLQDQLSPDAEAFRKVTNMRFEHWCV